MSAGVGTEAWWRDTVHALDMVGYLRTAHRMTRTRAGRRKLRLFACGCCRRAEPLFRPEDGLRQVLTDVEKWIDCGRPSTRPAEWSWVAVPDQYNVDVPRCLRAAVEHTRVGDIVGGIQGATAYTFSALQMHAGAVTEAFWLQEHGWQADLLRCIVGNPFRPVTTDPSWRTATVVGLAEAIYADRAFDRLPILADALEEAGCDSADVLAHCRGPGPHARGCWVVDLVLGKS